MKRHLGFAVVAVAGLVYGLGSGPGSADSGRRLMLIYSSDERGELHPCG
jgi:hypothetical protein